MANTPRLDPVSTKRQRIAELARDAPEMVFTSLAHHIDMHVLRTAYAATRKDGAVGLDGQTAADYAVHLEANLQSLLDRFKSGQYVAPPVRRVHIPKGDGRKTRPIGIPTFEDKVLQRAVVMVLESVYEQDFRDCSFGFRPGRSAHQALQHLWEQTMVMGGGWVRTAEQKWTAERRVTRPEGGGKPDRSSGPPSIPKVFCGTRKGCIEWSSMRRCGAASMWRG